jgi:exopolysaccharide biosynthesis polyprenyl glycosylphosphotransferase
VATGRPASSRVDDVLTGPEQGSPVASRIPVPRPRPAATDAPVPAPAARVTSTDTPAAARTPSAAFDPTVVIDLPGRDAPIAQRNRRLRAWMLTLPVDLLAFLTPLLASREAWKGIGVGAALTVALFAAGGHYQGRRHISFLDAAPSMFGRMLVSAAVVGIVFAERHASVAHLGGFLRQVAVSLAAVLAGRVLSCTAILFARRRRWVEHGAVIVGGGPVAIEIGRLIRRYPQYGLRFVGFVDVTPGAHHRPESLPLIGYLDELESRIARSPECEVVILADVDCPDTRLLEIARSPAISRCDLWMVPRLREFHAHGGIPDHIGAIPVVRVHRPAMSAVRRLTKRSFDIAFAAVALVLLSPVFVLCALAVFAEGGRGIFFHQQRIGQDGRPFRLVKFRSMRPVDDTEAQTRWSVADDPRIGPVGRFLRRTSLDEIPQLWNILRGDMTVVGPRPERPYFVDQFSAEHPDYAMRHRVPVGLTGLAQVSGLRGDTPISDRARFDNYYIENWSIWLDIKVLLRTVAEVFRGGGR